MTEPGCFSIPILFLLSFFKKDGNFALILQIIIQCNILTLTPLTVADVQTKM